MDLFPYIAVFLSIVITTFNYGYFSFQGLSVLICLYILLLLLFFKKKPNKLGKTLNVETIAYLFIITYTLFLFFSGGIYQINTLPSYLLAFLPLLSFPIVVTYTISPKGISKRAKVYRYVFLVGVAFFLRLFIIKASPAPVIDVFTMLKEGAVTLFNGKNPYQAIFTQDYSGVIPDYYRYFPASFLIQLPFIAVFRDPRVLLVVSEILSALLLFIIGKGKPQTEILSLIFLYRPNSIFITEQSWLVSLEFFFVVLIVWLLTKFRNRDFLSGILIGILASIKPYYAGLLPFFMLLNEKIITVFLGFLITFSFLTLPFFLWNPYEFMKDTLLFYFKHSSALSAIPIFNALSLNTLMYRLFGYELPNLLSLVIGVFVFALVFSKLVKIKKCSNFLSQLLLGIILIFLTFCLFFRFAFINYYYFVGGLIILWVVKLEVQNEK